MCVSDFLEFLFQSTKKYDITWMNPYEVDPSLDVFKNTYRTTLCDETVELSYQFKTVTILGKYTYQLDNNAIKIATKLINFINDKEAYLDKLVSDSRELFAARNKNDN